jgi:pilus assembly protein CpaD
MSKQLALFKLVASVTASLTLSGCFLNPDAMPPNDVRQTDQFYHSLLRLQQKVVEPQIEAVTMLHEVSFNFGEDKLSVDEMDRLAVFIAESKLDPHSRVSVDGPRKQSGSYDILTKARIDAIAAELREMGVRAQESPKPINSLAKPDEAIVVTVTRVMLIEPDCDVPKTIYGPRPTHVWSCSNAVALGRMVADPMDLHRGRTLGPADGETMARAIERYRTDKVKPLKGESTTGGSN